MVVTNPFIGLLPQHGLAKTNLKEYKIL